jgi:N-acetylglucosaminyldiphosphoundecaprenol N-acetyl-beta-D-mannosaminyltransferase
MSMMTEPEFIEVLDFKVFSDDLSLINVAGNSCRVINTISPNSYGITTKDPIFKSALQRSNYLVLDGVYFAFASLLLQGRNIKKNQGPDVFNHFINRLETIKGKAFFLGSSNDTLDKIKLRMQREYPGIDVRYYSPPFKHEFSDEDNSDMVKAINEFKPDILFVGMTCPKQEKWAIKFRDSLNAGLVICIGNVFDWFAGTQKAIHPIWFKLRLGWLIRIYYRPEIFKRNIKNQLVFFGDVILLFFRFKKA